jgi:hypothetical protein
VLAQLSRADAGVVRDVEKRPRVAVAERQFAASDGERFGAGLDVTLQHLTDTGATAAGTHGIPLPSRTILSSSHIL